MLLDAPGVAVDEGQRVPGVTARGLHQATYVRLGTAPAVNDVKHGGRAGMHAIVGRPRRLAECADRVLGEKVAHEVEVARMALEQQRGVAYAKRLLRSHERPASHVHDERVVAEHVAPARPRGAHAEVVLLAVARAECRIEHPDFVEQRATNVEAEADPGRQVRVARHRSRGDCGTHRFGIGSRWPFMVAAEQRIRTDLRVVGKWSDRADSGVGGGAAQQRVEPAGGDDRVGVEQDDVRARAAHAPVRRSREAEVRIVGEQRHVPEPARGDFVEQRPDRRIGRRVVDEHQPVVAAGVGEHGLHAAPQVVGRVVDGNDDLDRHVARRRAAFGPHLPRKRCHHRLTLIHGS